MEWDAWMDRVREYEERTFADWMDGERGEGINEATYDNLEEETDDA